MQNLSEEESFILILSVHSSFTNYCCSPQFAKGYKIVLQDPNDELFIHQNQRFPSLDQLLLYYQHYPTKCGVKFLTQLTKDQLDKLSRGNQGRRWNNCLFDSQIFYTHNSHSCNLPALCLTLTCFLYAIFCICTLCAHCMILHFVVLLRPLKRLNFLTLCTHITYCQHCIITHRLPLLYHNFRYVFVYNILLDTGS